MKFKKLLIGLLAATILFNITDIRTYAAETETETVVDDTMTTATETALEATDTKAADSNTETAITEEEKTKEEIEAKEEAKEKAEAKAKADAKAKAEIKAEKEAKEKAKKAEIKKKETAEYNKQVKLLAALIYTEAGNQPYKGKVGVANVVLNRIGSTKITSGKIRNVIYEPNQFYVVKNGAFKTAMNNYSQFDSGNEKESIKAAKAALNGRNYVGSRRYFTRYSRSLKNSHPSGIKIGDHYFW